METTKVRIKSIDALRGFDMLWIIGVDWLFNRIYHASPNGVTDFMKTQLDHVEWTGFHFYDIIMPLFLFIVGASMPFSLMRRMEQGESKKKIYLHVLKRFVILWIFGMLVQGNLLSYDIHKIKIYSNTLQAIASGYLISSILIMHLNRMWQIVSVSLLLLVSWLCVAFIYIPGHGTGIYTPQVNAAIYIDRLVFGSMQDGTTYAWILGTLNFAGTTMLGVFAGYILRSSAGEMKKFRNLIIVGLSLFAVSLLWHPFLPIVKHIWTSSFVLFSGGICFLMLAVFYLIIDVWKLEKWTALFIILGSNAILAYLVSHLLGSYLAAMSGVVLGGLGQWVGPAWQEVIQTAGGITLIIALMTYFYRKKIFLKV